MIETRDEKLIAIDIFFVDISKTTNLPAKMKSLRRMRYPIVLKRMAR